MKYIIGYIAKKIGLSTLITVISVFYFSAVIAFYVFIVNALLTLYSLIQDFIDLIFSLGNSPSSSGSLGVMSLFSSLLDTSGFLPALYDSMPLIISSLTFLLTKALWKYTLEAYRSIVKQVTEASMVL